MAEWHLHTIIHYEQVTVKYTFTRTPTNSPSNTLSKSNMRVHQVERVRHQKPNVIFLMVLPLPALIATIYIFTDWDLSKCRKVRRHLEPNFIYSLVIKVVVLVMDSTGAPRLLGVSPTHYIQDCNP